MFFSRILPVRKGKIFKHMFNEYMDSIVINSSCILCFSGQDVQWDFMHGLMENAIYGGRVDNTFDMRVLTSYLLQYFDAGIFSSAMRSRGGKRLVANITLPQSTNIKVLKC